MSNVLRDFVMWLFGLGCGFTARIIWDMGTVMYAEVKAAKLRSTREHFGSPIRYPKKGAVAKLRKLYNRRKRKAKASIELRQALARRK